MPLRHILVTYVIMTFYVRLKISKNAQLIRRYPLTVKNNGIIVLTKHEFNYYTENVTLYYLI